MLTVLASSPLHSIQDLGRQGLSRFGLASAGPMDAHASAWANKLLGNVCEAPLIEVCNGGFKCRFEKPTTFSVTGAPCDIRLDNKPIALWSSHFADTGSILEIGAFSSGVFGYLAVSGGFLIEQRLGSVSHSRRDGIGGLDGEAGPFTGDSKIPYKATFTKRTHQRTPRVYVPDYTLPLECEVILRNNDNSSKEARYKFLHQSYVVANEVSRIGYRLEGASIPVKVPRYSAPMPLGGIQITAAGKPVVLMRDHQTLGGYPLIATVTRRSLGMLAQRRPGQPVIFKEVSPDDARAQFEQLTTFFGVFK